MTSLLSSAAHLERLVPDDVVSAWQTPGERHQRNKVLRRVTYLFAVWAVLTAWALWGDLAAPRRRVGCTELPAEVVAATVAFGGTASWRLTGVETPINADGTGVPAAWQTNEVLIVVDVPPI